MNKKKNYQGRRDTPVIYHVLAFNVWFQKLAIIFFLWNISFNTMVQGKQIYCDENIKYQKQLIRFRHNFQPYTIKFFLSWSISFSIHQDLSILTTTQYTKYHNYRGKQHIIEDIYSFIKILSNIELSMSSLASVSLKTPKCLRDTEMLYR